jgi:glycosyltransferase involved in cell wall biosynthesis
MNIEQIVQQAAARFAAGDYAAALALYQQAARELGEASFAWNMAYCRSRMPGGAPAARVAGLDAGPEPLARAGVTPAARPETTAAGRPSIAVVLRSARNVRYLAAFEPESARPYNLRLYLPTADGLRPLHNAALLAQPGNDMAPLPAQLVLPACDLAATLDEQAILSERDLEQYLATRPAGGAHGTPLQALAPQFLAVVPGRVSVIVPTYKRPRNLRMALESVLAQDYPDVELIVVSDNPAGSPQAEETAAVVAAVQQQHARARLLFVQHRHNRNGAAARNTGLLRSTGEYICFLDDDDIYLPGRISRSVEVLKAAGPRVGAVYCGFYGWDSPVEEPHRYLRGKLTRELLALDFKAHYLHTNSATYKRQALLELNGFDETYRRHQDLELNIRFFERYEMDVVPAVLVKLDAEPSGVNNRVSNVDLIDLKQKFLDQFAYLIREYDEAARAQIYENHWREALTCVFDKQAVLDKLAGTLTDGRLQVMRCLR